MPCADSIDFERVGDLVGHPLLDAEATGQHANEPGQLADPDDLLVGDVADPRPPKNGSTWCSHSPTNGIGPSTIWASSQLAPPRHSVGNAVRSFGSPS